jgi:hypothetical protein
VFPAAAWKQSETKIPVDAATIGIGAGDPGRPYAQLRMDCVGIGLMAGRAA